MKLLSLATACSGLLLLTYSAQASVGSDHYLDSAFTTIPGPNGRETFEQAIMDIPALMRRFQPIAAEITGKTVEERGPRGLPRISFTATAITSVIKLRQTIRGDVRNFYVNCTVPGTEPVGYRLVMYLQDSDALVIRNASELFADLCLRELADGSVEVVGATHLIEGEEWNVAIGLFVKSMLRLQTEPLISALSSRARDIIEQNNGKKQER